MTFKALLIACLAAIASYSVSPAADLSGQPHKSDLETPGLCQAINLSHCPFPSGLTLLVASPRTDEKSVLAFSLVQLDSSKVAVEMGSDLYQYWGANYNTYTCKCMESAQTQCEMLPFYNPQLMEGMISVWWDGKCYVPVLGGNPDFMDCISDGTECT